MSEPKTRVTDANVNDFINSVTDEVKRRDCLVLLEMYTRLTDEPAKMWGPSMVGFGQYHYKSDRSAQEGDWLITGFSPRKQNLTLYFMLGFDDSKELLEGLGKHKTSVGCLYINKLSDVDLKVLEKLIKLSYEAMKKKYSVS